MNHVLTYEEAKAILGMIVAIDMVGGEFDVRFGIENRVRVSYRWLGKVSIEHGLGVESHNDSEDFAEAYGLSKDAL